MISSNSEIQSKKTIICSKFSTNSTPFSTFFFNGKEKDNESGFHYYGSRYYSSEISMWLSTDPRTDKYPSLSPYNYCANNPVKLIDPNGEEIDDYKLLQNGDIIRLENQTNKTKDVLYATYSNGDINEKIEPLNLPHGTLGAPDNDIGMEQNRQEEEGMSTMYIMLGQNINAAQGLFEFLDANTSNNLEFSLFEFKTSKENIFDYMITSSLDSNKDQFGYNVGKEAGLNINRHVHNHHTNFMPDEGDISFRNFNKQATYYIYMKGEGYYNVKTQRFYNDFINAR